MGSAAVIPVAGAVAAGMTRLLGQGDLGAGAIAVVVLLVLAFGLDLPIWLAAPLAVVTYVGVVLVGSQLGGRPSDGEVAAADRERRAYQTALTKVSELRVLARRIGKPEVRAQAERICDQADRVLAAMGEDKNLAAAPLFLAQLLEPTEALLTEYVRLSTRQVKSAEALLTQTETRNLPMIGRAAGAFYERLHRDSIVDLAALSEVLEFELEGIETTPVRSSNR